MLFPFHLHHSAFTSFCISWFLLPCTFPCFIQCCMLFASPPPPLSITSVCIAYSQLPAFYFIFAVHGFCCLARSFALFIVALLYVIFPSPPSLRILSECISYSQLPFTLFLQFMVSAVCMFPCFTRCCMSFPFPPPLLSIVSVYIANCQLPRLVHLVSQWAEWAGWWWRDWQDLLGTQFEAHGSQKRLTPWHR